MDFRVRRLEPGDAALFRDLRLSALTDAPTAFGASHDEEAVRTRDDWAGFLGRAQVFCAFAGDAAVGIAGLRRLERRKQRHRAELWGVYVRPAWRGRGAARALLHAVLQHADRLVEQVELHVEADNVHARQLYERYGFVACGRLPAALKWCDGVHDEIIMVRR